MNEMNMNINAAEPETVLSSADAMASYHITGKTTLGELLAMLGLTAGQKRNGKTPTRAALAVTGGAPIAAEEGCKVYENGYALYNNGLGRHTILWLPYCVNYAYHFNKLRDAEKEYLNERDDIPDKMLISTAWPIVVALFGEERITQNMFHGFGNCDTESIESDGDEQENDTVDEDADGEDFCWDDETLGVDPLEAVIRRERRETLLSEMTGSQRKVFVLTYKCGWTQERIADEMGVSQQAVQKLLSKAKCKAKKYFEKNSCRGL